MRSRFGALAAFALTVATIVPCLGAPDKAEARFEKAKDAYLRKDYRAAEKHFRALAKMAPDHLFTRMYLGHSLYYQEGYREAIPEYEKAVQINARSRELGAREERILTDNLGMSYGLSGQLTRAKQVFETAIQKDPGYPLYYYNLACTHAELGSFEPALDNLRLAFERRSGLLEGESFPNPRQDDSFARFLGKAEFERALLEMGFPP
jgi:tetratricopeptide (TPR) repeat protein